MNKGTTRAKAAAKVKRARAHGLQQEQRKQDALDRFKRSKKSQDKLTEFMFKEGYVPTRNGGWQRLPKESRENPGALSK